MIEKINQAKKELEKIRKNLTEKIKEQDVVTQLVAKKLIEKTDLEKKIEKVKQEFYEKNAQLESIAENFKVETRNFQKNVIEKNKTLKSLDDKIKAWEKELAKLKNINDKIKAWEKELKQIQENITKVKNSLWNREDILKVNEAKYINEKKYLDEKKAKFEEEKVKIEKAKLYMNEEIKRLNIQKSLPQVLVEALWLNK